jgi:hypothetical protein
LKFKSDFDELKGTIEKLKDDYKNCELKSKNDLNQLEMKKENEKQLMIETHAKQAKKAEIDFEEYKYGKKSELDRKDEESKTITEERKKKESEKNQKIKALTNKYTELIKKITSEYNVTLIQKDEEITRYRND